MYWNHGKATKNPSEELWKQLKWTNPSHRRQIFGLNMIQRCINQQVPRTTLLPTLHYSVWLEAKTSHMNTQHVQKWETTPFIQGGTGLEQVITETTRSDSLVLNWQQAACLHWHSYCTAVRITYCTAVSISYDTCMRDVVNLQAWGLIAYKCNILSAPFITNIFPTAYSHCSVIPTYWTNMLHVVQSYACHSLSMPKIIRVWSKQCR